MGCYLSGIVYNNKPAFVKFTTVLQNFISIDVYKYIIKKLWCMEKTPHILSCWAKISEKEFDYDNAYDALMYLLSHQTIPQQEKVVAFPIPKKQWTYALELARLDKEQKRFDAAVDRYCDLLLSGCSLPNVFFGLAEIASMRFDFVASHKLWRFVALVYPLYKPGKAHIETAKNIALCGKKYNEIIKHLCISCSFDPVFVSFVYNYNVFDEYTLKFYIGNSLSKFNNHINNKISYAKYLISTLHPDYAESVLLSYVPLKNEIIPYCITLSMSLSYQSKFDEAITIMQNIRSYYPTVAVYRELLRLGIMMGDYTFCSNILNAAQSEYVDVGEMYERKILAACNETKKKLPYIP